MIIKNIEMWFVATDYPRYNFKFTMEDGYIHEQSAYESKWGSDWIEMVFNLRFFQGDIMFFSNETMEALFDIFPNLIGSKCGLVKTKKNYRYLILT